MRSRLSFPRLQIEALEDRCVLDGVSFTAEPILPVIGLGMKAHLQAVYAQGQQLGNRPDVFAKVGDSISWLPNFLNDLGSIDFNPTDPAVAGSHTDLASTINYFRFQQLPGVINSTQGSPAVTAPVLPQPNGVNSFNRWSLAAYAGWGTAAELDPGLGYRLASELVTSRPAFALIMLGTNDVAGPASARSTPDEYRARLTTIVSYTLSQGVIPVLSTIPDIVTFGPAVDAQVMTYNQIVADVAASLNVPLWNFWEALQPLPNKGLSSDGGHPSTSPFGGGNFTDFGLLFGFNLRNLTAVEVLDKLKRIVIDNGTPDFTNVPLTAPTIQYVTSLYDTVLGHGPAAGGLNYWGELLENGVARADVSQAVWKSAEHRAAQVSQYYSAYLHRTPDSGEVAGWVNAFLAGWSEEQVQTGFLASAEYMGSHGSAGDFIAGLYHDVLGRTPDASGQAGWEQALQGGTSRARVAQAFLTSPEPRQQVIDGYYSSFLKRQADGADQYWLSLVQRDALSVEGVAEAVLASDEYFGTAH